MKPGQHEGRTDQLRQHIGEDEHGGQEPSAAPLGVHVIPLFGPLEPHPNAVLDEGGDQTEPGQSRRKGLRAAQHLITDKTTISSMALIIVSFDSNVRHRPRRPRLQPWILTPDATSRLRLWHQHKQTMAGNGLSRIRYQISGE